MLLLMPVVLCLVLHCPAPLDVRKSPSPSCQLERLLNFVRCEMQGRRGQDQQEVLRFGLIFMLYYFSDGDAGSQSERDSELCAPEDRQPPPGLSRADADEISYVRHISLSISL